MKKIWQLSSRAGKSVSEPPCEISDEAPAVDVQMVEAPRVTFEVLNG